MIIKSGLLQFYDTSFSQALLVRNYANYLLCSQKAPCEMLLPFVFQTGDGSPYTMVLTLQKMSELSLKYQRLEVENEYPLQNQPTQQWTSIYFNALQFVTTKINDGGLRYADPGIYRYKITVNDKIFYSEIFELSTDVFMSSDFNNDFNNDFNI